MRSCKIRIHFINSCSFMFPLCLCGDSSHSQTNGPSREENDHPYCKPV